MVQSNRLKKRCLVSIAAPNPIVSSPDSDFSKSLSCAVGILRLEASTTVDKSQFFLWFIPINSIGKFLLSDVVWWYKQRNPKFNC